MERFAGHRVVCAGLAGLIALGAGAPGALAQTLNITGPGGSLEDRLREHVFPAFEKEHGVTINYEASQTTEILAKMEAQRGNPQYDVISLADGAMFQAEERGHCAPLEPHPVYDELIEAAHPTPNSVGVSSNYTLIAIRTDLFEENGLPEPESWLDLGNPAYEGEMALLSLAASNTAVHTLAMVARAAGGSEENIDPGLEYFAEKIRPNLITILQSASKMQEMLQTGEVAIGVTASSRAAALASAGVPIKGILPKEGVPITMTAFCAVEGAANAELAQKFLQHSSSVESQQGFQPGEGPVNRNVEMIAPAAESGTGEIVTLDWDVINANRDAWIDRWNREVEG